MTGLTEEQQDRVDIIIHKLKFIEQKPNVACIISLKPLVFAGEENAKLISIAGGNAIMNLQNPDVIIVMLADHTIENTMRQMDKLLEISGFNELPAVKNNHLYIADSSTGDEVDTLELLAEIINPKQFIFGYEGERWIKFGV